MYKTIGDVLAVYKGEETRENTTALLMGNTGALVPPGTP
jgi:hypothetical protein